jgi:hypothetical protein
MRCVDDVDAVDVDVLAERTAGVEFGGDAIAIVGAFVPYALRHGPNPPQGNNECSAQHDTTHTLARTHIHLRADGDQREYACWRRSRRRRAQSMGIKVE